MATMMHVMTTMVMVTMVMATNSLIAENEKTAQHVQLVCGIVYWDKVHTMCGLQKNVCTFTMDKTTCTSICFVFCNL